MVGGRAKDVVQFDLAPPLLAALVGHLGGDRVESRFRDLAVAVNRDLTAAWGLLHLRGVSKQGIAVANDYATR